MATEKRSGWSDLGTLELASLLVSGVCLLCASHLSESEGFLIPGYDEIEIEGESVVVGLDGFLIVLELV